jgi:hypothetical protein
MIMASNTLSSDINPTDTTQSKNIYDLPLELRDMIYDDIHQQEDVRVVGGQLIVRYTPSPARYRRAGKEIAHEINRRLPPNQIHRLEVTQKNMIFLPENQNWILPEKMLPQGKDALLTMNFNINEGPEDIEREKTEELFEWIDNFVISWNPHSESYDSPVRETSMHATLPFWFCSMEAFDLFASYLDMIYYDRERIHDCSTIELMFYEREDHIAYPNKAAVAGAKMLYFANGTDGLKLDHGAIKQARKVSKRLLYNRVDPSELEWFNQSYSDEEDSDQGGDSDGESSGDSEYSDEEVDEDSDEWVE